MEYVIAIFVGLWIASAGLLAYRQISKDYSEPAVHDKKEDVRK